jgi:hypothetical protein
MSVEDLAATVAPSGALDQHSLVELFTYLASTSRKKQIGRFCPFERTLHVASAAMKWDIKKSSLMNIQAVSGPNPFRFCCCQCQRCQRYLRLSSYHM